MFIGLDVRSPTANVTNFSLGLFFSTSVVYTADMFLVEGVQQHVFYVTLCVTPTRDVSTLGVAPATNVDAGRGILAKEANARREPSSAESGRVEPDDTAL